MNRPAPPLCFLAVTGGAAEGKTTVLEALREMGVATASADEMARALWEDPRVLSEIAEELDLPLPLDRDQVRERVFASPEARRRLNALLHPKIVARMTTSRARAIEVPLLYETCLQGMFRRVWVVTCGPEEQTRRLVARTGSLEAARRVTCTQLPTVVKCAFADAVVRTNQSLPSVKRAVESLSREHGVV